MGLKARAWHVLGECSTSEPHLQPRGVPVTILKSIVDMPFGKPKRVKEKKNWERVGGTVQRLNGHLAHTGT